MKNEKINAMQQVFDKIKQVIKEEDVEFWFARDLQETLGYERWENFYKVILKAIKACNTSGGIILDHFRDVTKMVSIGSGAERLIRKINETTY